MLLQASKHPNVKTLLMDAVRFAELPPVEMRYKFALMLAAVHHIPCTSIPSMFSGMAKQLLPGGAVLVITRHQNPDYPFFIRAKEIWAENQPHHSVYASAMAAAGLSVIVEELSQDVNLSLQSWLNLIRCRHWSTFSLCTTDELEQGIAELAAKYGQQQSVSFVDRLLLIKGKKALDCLKDGTDGALRPLPDIDVDQAGKALFRRCAFSPA
eukprot:gene6566-6794_t